MAERYDVILVGAGPAGIFAALELANTGLKTLLLEKGPDLSARPRPGELQRSTPTDPRLRWQITGFGGAGAYSDGKLTLSTDVGGRLDTILGVESLRSLLRYVDDVYMRYGGTDRVYGLSAEVEEMRREAARAGLRLVPAPIKHLGTDRSFYILEAIREELGRTVEIRTGVAAEQLQLRDGRVVGVRTSTGEDLAAEYVVVAPGREGSQWLLDEARRLGLDIAQSPVDIGVRVEVPAPVLDKITSVVYESKLELYTRVFDDRIRTFCMCPGGEVTMEHTGGEDAVITVNGHSYAERKTDNTNFALLISTTFTEPFREPNAYGRYVARLANLLGGGVIVQRLGDLLAGRRSTPERLHRGLVTPTLRSAAPGDLSFVLPYRYLSDILEMLQAMDRLAPGIYERHTLLYGVEVKFYSVRLRVSPQLETDISNLFAAGDGAGVTRGLVQASASGVVAAREIIRRAGAGSS
ncbi:MAG: FAD-dependent oxidoreductase [Chloroflexi bacterium]|nr:FAD-dependent oxidoreductase [Chloroflexota bacterium]